MDRFLASRFTARFASVLTIAVVTTGLVLRLSQHRHHKSIAVSPSVSTVSSPAVAAVAAPPLPFTEPSPAWKIAYIVSDYNTRKSDLWTMNADGTGKRHLFAHARTPAWSPDRRHLAFERGGNLWVCDADGNGQKQITFWPAGQKDASGWPRELYGISWNESAHLISFGRLESFDLTRADGSHDSLWGTTLYHASLMPGPRSKRYPFVESPTASPAAWKDEEAYKNPQDLPGFDVTDMRTRFAFSDNAYPAWSPSGTRCAFVRNGDLWMATREAPDAWGDRPIWWIKRIAACAVYDDGVGYGDHWVVGATNVCWAPDESYLIYDLRRLTGSGQEDVHIVRIGKPMADSRDNTYQDETIAGGYSPCISPDGKWILTRYQQKLVAISTDGAVTRTLPNIKGQDAVW